MRFDREIKEGLGDMICMVGHFWVYGAVGGSTEGYLERD
jgi:hypothetical protein